MEIALVEQKGCFVSDFKITEERIGYICGQFGITDPADIKTVEDLHCDFLYFYDKNVRGQYLAPVVIATERYIQEAYKKPGFKITTTQMRECNARRGMAVLKWEENRYDIYIPISNDKILIRNIVAHELGHLFYVMNCSHGGNAPFLVKDGCLADKMADILGVFTIAERTDFYINKAQSVCRNNFADIVEDFKKMGMGRRWPQNPASGTLRSGDKPPA